MAGGLCAARAVVVALVGAVWARAEQAVVFDAGSTGTRVHVITYAPAPHADMPAITHLASSKVEPGLSAFARSPDDAAATIAPLLRFAERHVAEGARTRTPLMLYGTAGMRLLSNADQRRVYASALRACEASAFSIVRSSFTTLSGSDEGFFGLLALMWLQVTATATVARPTAGILDLGGGSTQIAFPTTAEAAAAAAGEPSAGGADAAEREEDRPRRAFEASYRTELSTQVRTDRVRKQMLGYTLPTAEMQMNSQLLRKVAAAGLTDKRTTKATIAPPRALAD